MFSLGIDLGGTKTNFGLVEIEQNSFKILSQTAFPSPQKAKDLARLLEANIKNLLAIRRPEKIGLAQAGLIDRAKKINLASPNLKVLENFDLTRILEKQFHLPVATDNDANAFTLAEATYGAGRGREKIVGLTLGTGIGGGIVLAGKIYHGAYNSAAEFGHMIIDYNGRKCGCGKKGCLEAYASATAIVQEYENRSGRKRDTYAIEAEAKKNLEPAKSIFTKASNYLAIGLANIINILEPQIIVLGGGLSQIKLFIEPAIFNTKKFTFGNLGECVEIATAKLGANAGLIGAALL